MRREGCFELEGIKEKLGGTGGWEVEIRKFTLLDGLGYRKGGRGISEKKMKYFCLCVEGGGGWCKGPDGGVGECFLGIVGGA